MGVTADSIESMTVVPCRGMVLELPVIVLGGGRQVGLLLEIIDKDLGREWGGVKRYIDMYMAGDDPQWMWSKRRLCLILPPSIKCPKV